MWHSPNAGHVPDVKFLRAAGIEQALLALGSGAVSLIGAGSGETEPPLQMAEAKPAEAKSLELGAAALFRAVDQNIARRHELGLYQFSQEGETR